MSSKERDLGIPGDCGLTAGRVKDAIVDLHSRIKIGHADLFQKVRASQTREEIISLLQEVGYKSIGEFIAMSYDYELRDQKGELQSCFFPFGIQHVNEVTSMLEEKGLITPLNSHPKKA